MIELRGETDKFILTVGDLNMPLSEMDRSGRQKISKGIVEFDNIVNHFDITDIYGLFHPKRAEYIFFLSLHGTSIKTPASGL